MAGDGRLSLSSALWRNTDGTLPRSTRSSVTSASALFPELPVERDEEGVTSMSAELQAISTR